MIRKEWWRCVQFCFSNSFGATVAVKLQSSLSILIHKFHIFISHVSNPRGSRRWLTYTYVCGCTSTHAQTHISKYGMVPVNVYYREIWIVLNIPKQMYTGMFGISLSLWRPFCNACFWSVSLGFLFCLSLVSYLDIHHCIGFCLFQKNVSNHSGFLFWCGSGGQIHCVNGYSSSGQ